MKRYEFTSELSDRAFDVYSNSDFTFYHDGDQFHVADNPKAKAYPLGSLEDVETFLLQFADEEDIDND